MFQLKIILRNIRRGGIYSAINIGGLAIGMAAAILILTWIYHEWSYDRFHAKVKNLYVVHGRVTDNIFNSTPKALGPVLKTDYPVIKGVARMSDETLFFAKNDDAFKIKTGITDPDFLTMFDFPLLQGDRETALNDPYSVILTEKAAIRLFGQEAPMGKTLLVNNQFAVTVSGIMKDLPGNTVFQFEALAPVAFMKAIDNYVERWTSLSLVTYVELQPNANLDLVNESIREIIQTNTDNRFMVELFLHPLGKLHLYDKYDNGVLTRGELMKKMQLFGVIAGLVLLIACINFINLSTARSRKRAKETGVRKVMGGKRLSLIGLFLGESITVSFIAGAIALMIALVVLPVFSMLIGQQLTMDLTNGWFWPAILGFILFTGLLAGSYPAFYLSSFLPVKVLKGIFESKRELFSLRKVLVVLQFTVASALIVSTLVVHRQIRYANDRESGYKKDQLIYSRFVGNVHKNYELIRQELLSSGTALSVMKSLSPMTESWASSHDAVWQGKDPDIRINFDYFSADADWTQTTGTAIIEGRDIDIHTYPTDSTAMLLNETAVKAMNLENPIGEIVSTQGIDWHVVGVVKDFIMNSPYKPIEPMIICGPKNEGWFNFMHIKLNDHNRMADNIAQAAQIFKQFNPSYPFEYNFIDEEYARKFNEEKMIGTLATWFAGLTIFISCLGLFALVAYMAETRRKEIGIRKVLGASVSSVMFLLSKEFLILVLISVAITSPISWWAMNKWLSNYAYRTDIPWWLFVVVGCISLGIALLTVGFQAIKAATVNPVEAIKSE